MICFMFYEFFPRKYLDLPQEIFPTSMLWKDFTNAAQEKCQHHTTPTLLFFFYIFNSTEYKSDSFVSAPGKFKLEMGRYHNGRYRYRYSILFLFTSYNFIYCITVSKKRNEHMANMPTQ